jgi:hypothetical protein
MRYVVSQAQPLKGKNFSPNKTMAHLWVVVDEISYFQVKTYVSETDGLANNIKRWSPSCRILSE